MAYRRRGDEILVNSQTEGSQSSPRIERLDSGDFFISWLDLVNGYRGQLFDSNGGKIGGEGPGNQPPPGQLPHGSESTRLAGGGSVVAWTEGTTKAQVYDSAGHKLGGEILVSSETRFMDNAQVAALASGGFVVVWTKNTSMFGPEEYRGIYAQVFTANGARVGAERLIAPEGPASFDSLDVDGLATGGFVVTWASDFHTGSDGSGTAIKAQQLDDLGNEVGGELIVNATTIGDQVHPAVIGLASGDFFITWGDRSETGGDSDGSAIRAQLFRAHAAIQGTADDDTLIGTRRSDMILGGLGDDVLWGGPGDDTLDGGPGGDYMEGGIGDDVYLVDSVCDTVEEFADSGTDEIRTALGTRTQIYTLPDFVENLTGLSSAAQTVEGNSLDNVILMGGGNDLVVLDDGGDDVVAGGAGNDFFYYGSAWTAADRTDGGAGTDTIGLIGSTNIVLGSGSLIGVERLALYTGLPDAPAHYVIKTVDGNVPKGSQLFVTAASLKSNETLTFNGASESDGGKFVIHGGAGNDVITGGDGYDFIIGNAGNDILSGREGVDVLIGGLGADQMRGGFFEGDNFRYLSSAESTQGNSDHILDFKNFDRIDLSAIDANANAADGNNAFSFIGAAAFNHSAGELRAYQSGGSWWVEGDTNGDGNADLVIQVNFFSSDAPPLAALHFIL